MTEITSEVVPALPPLIRQRNQALETFLHVNQLNPFQRVAIYLLLDFRSNEDVYKVLLSFIDEEINSLSEQNWSPTQAGGDLVNQPAHYARFPIEPTYFNQENNIDWCRGNVLKYLCRFPYKNGIQDLEKAYRYLVMYTRFSKGQRGWSQ